jgi:hypothetical protein
VGKRQERKFNIVVKKFCKRKRKENTWSELGLWALSLESGEGELFLFRVGMFVSFDLHGTLLRRLNEAFGKSSVSVNCEGSGTWFLSAEKKWESKLVMICLLSFLLKFPLVSARSRAHPFITVLVHALSQMNSWTHGATMTSIHQRSGASNTDSNIWSWCWVCLLNYMLTNVPSKSKFVSTQRHHCRFLAFSIFLHCTVLSWYKHCSVFCTVLKLLLRMNVHDCIP